MEKNERSVVILDDSEIDQFFARREVEKMNYFGDIYQFMDPRKALEFFSQRQKAGNVDEAHPSDRSAARPIDILLLDFRMPYLNGLEYLEALRRDGHEQLVTRVVVMLTIPLLPTDEDSFLDAHDRVTFVEKPLEADQLMDVMRAA